MEPGQLQAYLLPCANRLSSRAKLVPRIRESVNSWRRDGYLGATSTSRHLLRYWFESSHVVSGEPWLYYYCQREAVETTVYLYEVLKARSLWEMTTQLGDGQSGIMIDPHADRWCRYVYKMATGSGKTKVMSLLVAWSYFNAVREKEDKARDYSTTFLVLAPNVVVYERLFQDFGGGRIFAEDPVIPPEWSRDWQMEVVTRDAPRDSVQQTGALFVTNIQQMYSATRNRRRPGEPRQLRDLIGEPVVESDVSAGLKIRQALGARSDLLILNDEGHHIHDSELRWSETIAEFDAQFRHRTGIGLKGQFDFSATPKHNDGRLFDEVIVDYPIREAICHGVVKTPQLAVLENAAEHEVEDASDRYRDKLTAGINRYEELCSRLKGSGHRPLMFVMTEDTDSADEIGHWFATREGFSREEVLVIHTNKDGTYSQAQGRLDELRRDARMVDSRESRYKVIVSVLMLREGWDVRNVCVIVPLRPYSAASQILPEQTLGRGLRRMFPLGSGDEREQLLVIDHEQFASFWRDEIDGESIPIEVTNERDFEQTAETVLADESRAPALEVAIPRLSARMQLVAVDLGELDVCSLDIYRIELRLDSLSDEPIYYNVRDMATWNVLEVGEITREFPLNRVGYLNHVCGLILKECKLSGVSDGFAKLAPKVQEYIEDVGFAGQASLGEDRSLQALNNRYVTNMLLEVFVRGVNQLSIREQCVGDVRDPILASRTRPYVTRRRTVTKPRRSLFNHVPIDSDLEGDFTRWLDRVASDVAAYVKNVPAVGFRLEYLSDLGGIRHYYPDFVVRLKSGDMYVVETKGLETAEVQRKDQRVRQWCRDAESLTGRVWRYVKVTESLFARGDGWTSLESLAASVRG